MSVPDKSIDPRLLASAKAEFQKRGFLKAELKTICKNANITTGAVYKRYKGKEDLFCAVVDDIAKQLDLFVKERSNIDFASLSDEETYQTSNIIIVKPAKNMITPMLECPPSEISRISSSTTTYIIAPVAKPVSER